MVEHRSCESGFLCPISGLGIFFTQLFREREKKKKRNFNIIYKRKGSNLLSRSILSCEQYEQTYCSFNKYKRRLQHDSFGTGENKVPWTSFPMDNKVATPNILVSCISGIVETKHITRIEKRDLREKAWIHWGENINGHLVERKKKHFICTLH